MNTPIDTYVMARWLDIPANRVIRDEILNRRIAEGGFALKRKMFSIARLGLKRARELGCSREMRAELFRRYRHVLVAEASYSLSA